MHKHGGAAGLELLCRQSKAKGGDGEHLHVDVLLGTRDLSDDVERVPGWWLQLPQWFQNETAPAGISTHFFLPWFVRG